MGASEAPYRMTPEELEAWRQEADARRIGAESVISAEAAAGGSAPERNRGCMTVHPSV